MTIVALHSPWPRCGKTAASDHLVQKHGFRRLAFARPLKMMVSDLLACAGVPEERIFDYVYGAKKEEIIPEIGVSSRRLQQTLGTEWGRKTIDDDLWINIAHAQISALTKADRHVNIVIDDMRFPNEFDLMTRWGGVTVRLTRPDAKPEVKIGHKSEAGLDPTQFDYDLVNNGSLAELFAKMDSLVAQNTGKHLYH